MNKNKTPKGLNIGLWVVQGLLAAAFLLAGFTKISTPIEELANNGMSFVDHFSAGTVRFIGVSEMLGAIGLIIPAVFRFKPFLTPLSALGIATIMASATIYHITQSEAFVHTFVLFALASFVAWGRFKKAPISPK